MFDTECCRTSDSKKQKKERFSGHLFESARKINRATGVLCDQKFYLVWLCIVIRLVKFCRETILVGSRSSRAVELNKQILHDLN